MGLFLSHGVVPETQRHPDRLGQGQAARKVHEGLPAAGAREGEDAVEDVPPVLVNQRPLLLAASAARWFVRPAATRTGGGGNIFHEILIIS